MKFQRFCLHSCVLFRTTTTVPWVPEVFLACGGNFRCWPKADTSLAVGRSHERRNREKNARVTIKTWQKPETALEKSLAPRVRRRQQQRKRHPKSDDSCSFKLHRSYSSCFKLSNVAGLFFRELNSKGLYLNSQKEKRKPLSCDHFLHKTWNIRKYHVVVVQRRQRNVQKSLMSNVTCAPAPHGDVDQVHCMTIRHARDVRRVHCSNIISHTDQS